MNVKVDMYSGLNFERLRMERNVLKDDDSL
jgi:hypothetical protein